MTILAGLKAAGLLAVVLLGFWLVQKLRKGARAEQRVKDLEAEIKIKDMQLLATPATSPSELAERVRNEGGF